MERLGLPHRPHLRPSVMDLAFIGGEGLFHISWAAAPRCGGPRSLDSASQLFVLVEGHLSVTSVWPVCPACLFLTPVALMPIESPCTFSASVLGVMVPNREARAPWCPRGWPCPSLPPFHAFLVIHLTLLDQGTPASCPTGNSVFSELLVGTGLGLGVSGCDYGHRVYVASSPRMEF